MLLRIDEGIEGGEDALDVLIAGRDVLLRNIRACEGLGEGAHLYGAVIPLQRFGHGLLVRLHARVPRLGEGLRITFSRDHGAEHAHSRHPCPITHHVVQRERHLIERLVQVLPVLDRHLEQMVPVAEETAEPAQSLRRTQRGRQQPIRRELVEPSTIEAIRFRASWHVLDVAGMDQSDLKAAGFEDLQQGNPVHARGCHSHRRDPAGREPVGQAMHVTGKGAQCLERLGIAVWGDADPMLLRSHIDASGMRMDEGHVLGRGRVLLAFFGQRFLQSG
jgi:hypothetical protein